MSGQQSRRGIKRRALWWWGRQQFVEDRVHESRIPDRNMLVLRSHGSRPDKGGTKREGRPSEGMDHYANVPWFLAAEITWRLFLLENVDRIK
jgi:hypothetical protein